MTLSKRLSILLAVTSLMVSCVKADRTKETQGIVESFSLDKSLTEYNNRAMFQSGQIELEDIKFSHDGRSKWKQVNRIQLYFKVCGLKDAATQGTLIGEKFSVHSELGGANINPVPVTSQSCLRWTQTVPEFNYIAPSLNMVFHFEIQSLSGSLGKITKRFGFNPWDMYRNKGKSKAAFDLTDADRSEWQDGRWVVGEDAVVKALKGEYLKGQARLEMKTLSVEPIEREKQRKADYNKRLAKMDPKERKRRESIDKQLLKSRGVQMSINMSAVPFVRVTDSTGVPHDESITTGRFRIYMNLIASGASDDDKKYLLSQNTSALAGGNASAFTWTMGANGLLASVPMVLQERSEFGRVELAVKIEPLDLDGVAPFMAVYDMGQYNNWVKKQNPQFKAEKHELMTDVAYDDYIKQAGGRPNDLATLREAERFYFGPLNMRFVRIMPGETATDRTLMYSVTTCVKHGLYGTTVGPGLQFDIQTDDERSGRIHKSKIRRQTNEKGCLTWFGELSHKYYHKEVLKEKTAQVRFVGTKKNEDQWAEIINKYEKQFVYYMNPWDEKWTFGWDKPDMPDNYHKQIEEQKATAPASKLFIADFRYETMGFRYAIDKYLKLKVKKAVLLKAYPYVLKYNSMVLGRNATEKLRDGVYLMKIALQKDYLDPAAKGVKIYDHKSKEVLTLGQKSESHPRASYTFTGRPGDLENIDHKLLTQTQLKEGKKEYISIQQKLVRVLGGMIITPVEFEVDDLRLMRIRNQVFMQLQTIDEHKLRLATVVDQTLNELYKDGNIEGRYADIFKQLENIEDIENKKIRLEQDNRNSEIIRADVAKEIHALGMSLIEARGKLYKVFGLDKDKQDPKEFERLYTRINEKLKRLDQYRKLNVDEQTAFRNDTRSLTNRIIQHFGARSQSLMKEDWAINIDKDYVDAYKNDPMQRLFNFDENAGKSFQRILDYKIGKAKEKGDGQVAKDLNMIRSADFTESPLAPNFSFDLLANDGLKEHQSGLPARTFVGPLTFVFNTNGSSLRPTDILNEKYCTTAFCEESKMIEQGVPPEKTEKSFSLDENGGFKGNTEEPVYDSGDSVNANYENNKYYGYLKAYHNMTVDDLIKEKVKIDERYTRKMEEGSQIINFIKTMKLKYSVLDDSSPDSHLKAIDHDCAQTRPLDKIGTCFQDVHGSSDVIQTDDLFGMLNDRLTVVNGKKISLDRMNAAENYNSIEGDLTKEEMLSVMEKGWKNDSLKDGLTRKLFHRMCFTLSQNFFSKKYLKKRVKSGERASKAFMKGGMNQHSVTSLETLCHDRVKDLFKDKTWFGSVNEKAKADNDVFAPIIFERKVRVNNTTGRYVYRGGKSLNINVSANFNISSSSGLKVSTSASFKPWSWVKDLFGKIPLVGDVVKNIAGGFDITRSAGIDESTGLTNGTTVSSGTFLVSQQASFDIELGSHERCMVARFHPAFIKTFISGEDNLKSNFNDDEDIESVGIMICSGQPTQKCLPIKEKYYYFTQHFTEGDMLDSADLHNHPWLLQLRGYRDFQTFVHQIGGKPVDYTNGGKWLSEVASRVTSDAMSFNMGAGKNENERPQFEVVNKKEHMNWPLEELSRTFFQVLPTFPGLYTFSNEDGKNVADWPHKDTQPGLAFDRCE